MKSVGGAPEVRYIRQSFVSLNSSIITNNFLSLLVKWKYVDDRYKMSVRDDPKSQMFTKVKELFKSYAKNYMILEPNKLEEIRNILHPKAKL